MFFISVRLLTRISETVTSFGMGEEINDVETTFCIDVRSVYIILRLRYGRLAVVPRLFCSWLTCQVAIIWRELALAVCRALRW